MWQYYTLDTSTQDDYKTLEEDLDLLGQVGWELVCSQGSILFFKKPLKHNDLA
jgi:hypothetical protein